MNEIGQIFHHILVPTDGSQPSNDAGETAVQLALIHHARLTFVYVVDDSVVDKLTISMHKSRDNVIRDLNHSGQQYLDHLVRMTRNTDLKTNTVICQGNPWNEIDRLARKEGVDLIVIGQVGRSLARHTVIGPVAERVIQIAACPVLVIK
ncbi:MAG: universal stress protein [Anaerolineae bacterium]|jgi:nucleotide-binding universal stress UspA family protein|nr:universal stress protein [Anaerolineae bacterium]